MKSVRTRALANLALVKYFGKRDLTLNLPAAGSLSLTLEPLETITEVTWDPSFSRDEVWLGGERAAPKFQRRVFRFLDLVRQLSGNERFFRVVTTNSFPTAAGLASSASGFAALALAATKCAGLDLGSDELSVLARRGSGSAARSITGGISLWQMGERDDGSDSFATTLLSPSAWDLRVIVGVTELGSKAVGSTDAMEHTRMTSPYYEAWIRSVETDLVDAVQAVRERDFQALGEVTERSALSMHAATLAARPAIPYWNGTTIEALHLIRRLRQEGLDVYFTCDAGPQPKALCTAESSAEVQEALKRLPGVKSVIPCRLGNGVRVI
jgi:diphosphomevalonate decarboxylase